MVNVVQVTDDFQGNIGIQSEKLNHHILKFKSQVTFLSYRYSLFPVPNLKEWLFVKEINGFIYVIKTSVTQII